MTNDFEKLCSYLSSFNLENLALSSALISSMEYYNNPSTDYPYFMPMVNNAMANMFTKTLLYSDSNYFRKRKIDQSSIPFILNSLINCSDRFDILENPELDPGDKIDQVIMSMFSSQLWYNRDITKEKISLIYSQYHEIPSEFSERLKEEHGNHFVDIPDFIKNEIGLDLSKYLISCVYLIYGHFKNLYKHFLEPTDYQKHLIQNSEGNENQQNQLRQQLIVNILESATSFYQEFSFSKQPLIFNRYSFDRELGFLNPDELDAFLNLTSKSIFELRKLNQATFHKKGHISQRLTPFERYPILKLDFPNYIIPNLRFFELGITELLRFELQQSFEENNEFHQVMGTIQELLIIKLLSQLESEDFLIIPERTYEKNKSEYKGPDIIVIDRGRPILIESKAKQLLLDTRLKPDPKTVSKNIEVATDAIVELEQNKFNDLYEDDIYNDIQGKLIDKNEVNPLFVGLLAEGPITMQEQVAKLKDKIPDHKLNELKAPHIFIDVFNFYRAVEICKSNNLRLYDILNTYWEVGNDLSPKKNPSDSFEGIKYDLRNSFSKSKYDSMIKGIFPEH